MLLVSIDTLRADHVGCYGDAGAATANLDAIAAAGVRFETAISPAPLTLPSHTTLLSGLEPPHHGVRQNGVHRVPADLALLAERFRAAGWATGAAVGSSVLAGKTGIAQGFDFFDDRISGNLANTLVQRRAADVAEAALGWLGSAPRPFFLFVHFYDPHASYEPPPPWDERFAGRLYDGEIAYADDQLGRLLAWLTASGELERTLVVATADHGESLGEHHEQSHGHTLYDATQRVPLLVRGPFVPAGRVVAGVVRLSDVAPTLAALAGVAPAPTDGTDLTPLWGEAPSPPRLAYVETLAGRLAHGWAALHGVRSASHLYIRVPRPELYEVARDPAQSQDLLAGDAGAAAEAREPLARALETMLVNERAPESVAVDAAARAQLEALGYAIAAAPVAANEIDPKDALPGYEAYSQGELALNEGRFADAVALFEKALRVMPSSPSAHASKGMAHFNLGQRDPALLHSKRAVALAPDVLASWLQLAQVHALRGEHERALEALAHAEQLDPSERLVQLRSMESLVALGRGDEAEARAERAVALDPQDAALRQRIADAWEKAGDSQRAARAYLAALALAPASKRSHMHAAVHLARGGRSVESDEHLAQAGTLRAQPKARLALGRAYEDAKQPERAAAEYRALLAADAQYAKPAREGLARLGVAE